MDQQSDNVLTALNARRRAFERCLAAPEVQAYLKGVASRNNRPAFRTCPCCGYPTLYERARYDGCVICDWEDDGQDDPEFAPHEGNYVPDEVAGGPNADYSLTEARFNFAQHGQIFRPSDEAYLKRSNQNTDLGGALRRVFDLLLPSVEPDAYVAVLPEVTALTKRKYENYNID